MAKPTEDDIELDLADPDLCDEDGDELREPTAEEMAAFDAPTEPELELGAIGSGFEARKQPLPQPDRARSSPDLPRVKAIAFKRFIA